MDLLVQEEMKQHLLHVHLYAVTTLSHPRSNVMIITLSLEMVVVVLAKLKMDGNAIFNHLVYLMLQYQVQVCAI